MRNILAAVAAVALSAGVVMAQGAPAQPAQPETKKETKAPKAKAPKQHTLAGTIEAVDAATGKLSVKDAKGAVKEFTLTPDVKIAKSGKPLTAAELTAGEKVTVKYAGTPELPELKSVQVHAAKAKGEKKAGKKAEQKPAEQK